MFSSWFSKANAVRWNVHIASILLLEMYKLILSIFSTTFVIFHRNVITLNFISNFTSNRFASFCLHVRLLSNFIHVQFQWQMIFIPFESYSNTLGTIFSDVWTFNLQCYQTHWTIWDNCFTAWCNHWHFELRYCIMSDRSTQFRSENI